LIFDGRSVAAAADGRVVAGLAAFQEELRVVTIGAAHLPAAEEGP